MDKSKVIRIVMAVILVVYGIFQFFLLRILVAFTTSIPGMLDLLLGLMIALVPFAGAYMLLSQNVILRRIGYGIFGIFALFWAVLYSIYSS